MIKPSASIGGLAGEKGDWLSLFTSRKAVAVISGLHEGSKGDDRRKSDRERTTLEGDTEGTRAEEPCGGEHKPRETEAMSKAVDGGLTRGP